MNINKALHICSNEKSLKELKIIENIGLNAGHTRKKNYPKNEILNTPPIPYMYVITLKIQRQLEKSGKHVPITSKCIPL